MFTNLKQSILLILLISNLNIAQAQFTEEDADEIGITNPSEFSWPYYKESLKRFPERAGMICFNAYMLDKAGRTEDTLEFFKACADHGSVASMIYLSSMYENGNRLPIDYVESAKWLKRAANTLDEAGYSDLASYHYGMALYKGQGVEKDLNKACHHFKIASEAGIEEASMFFEKHKSSHPHMHC